jgi:hypothetical protein
MTLTEPTGGGGGAYARSRIFYQVQTTAYTQENLDDSFLNKSRKQILTQWLSTGLTKKIRAQGIRHMTVLTA